MQQKLDFRKKAFFFLKTELSDSNITLNWRTESIPFPSFQFHRLTVLRGLTGSKCWQINSIITSSLHYKYKKSRQPLKRSGIQLIITLVSRFGDLMFIHVYLVLDMIWAINFISLNTTVSCHWISCYHLLYVIVTDRLPLT